jgi:heptosyltransferase-2
MKMIKNIIIKSSHSKLSSGELKSNFGDLIRCTVLLNCIQDKEDFLWITDERSIGLLKFFVPLDKIITAKKELENFHFSDDLQIYNADNYIFDIDIFQTIRGTWHGYILNPSKNLVTPANSLIASTEAYTQSQIKESWQQNFVEGMGFNWEEQDYALCTLDKKEDLDIGLNWNIHPEWKSKHWSYEKWQELSELLKSEYAVSWQQGLDNFEEYIHWLNSCRLIVTGDTLGLHLASALRKKVIAIIGPTENKEFSYGRIISLRPSYKECMPCNSPLCKTQANCLNEITPEMIKKTIAKVLIS